MQKHCTYRSNKSNPESAVLLWYFSPKNEGRWWKMREAMDLTTLLPQFGGMKCSNSFKSWDMLGHHAVLSKDFLRRRSHLEIWLQPFRGVVWISASYGFLYNQPGVGRSSKYSPYWHSLGANLGGTVSFAMPCPGASIPNGTSTSPTATLVDLFWTLRFKCAMLPGEIHGLRFQKTRWSPRTRMLTRMLMVQMSKHMVTQSRTIPFCNSLYLNSLVHVSLVTSLQCGVESVECGVWSKECGV